MRIRTIAAGLSGLYAAVSAQRLPAHQGRFTNFSSQSSEIFTSSQQPVSCSCSVVGIEIYHTFPGEFQQENETYYVTIIPYVTPEPDGSYVTSEVTVTLDANNSTVQGNVGLSSATEAPTWVVSGVTLTYPTTYVENNELSAQVFTSANSGGVSTCEPADSFLALDLPPNSATGLIFPLYTTADLSEPITWVPGLRKYLDGLPEVQAQFASEGGIDFASCRGSPTVVPTASTAAAPVVKTTVAVLVTSQASPVTLPGPTPAAQQNPSLPTSTVSAATATPSDPQGPQTNNNIQATPPFPFQASTQSSGGSSTGVGDYIIQGLGDSTTNAYTGPVATGAAKRDVDALDDQARLGALMGGLLALVAVF